MDLNYDIQYIDIVITLSTGLSQDDFYETAITPGEEFGLFTTTETLITKDSIFSTYYSLLLQNFSQSDMFDDFSTYKRALVSRDSSDQPYVYKANTKIVVLDMATNKYYYYVVTAEDEANGKNIYYLKDFLEMGSTDSYYDETNVYTSYYYQTQDLIYENFICHVDISESNITEDAINNTLYIELQDSEDNTLIGIYEPLRENAKYSIYTDKTATINVNAETPDIVYLGEEIDLDVTTNFTQATTENHVTIYDTKYLNSKMGIKISIFDSNGNQLNSDSLLGMTFEYDGQTYYPRIDGTVRIKIADRISNVLSRIKIDTANNKNLATDTYTIKIESFGSPDGIYYGLDVSDYAEKTVRIINSAYGLKVTTDEQTKIVDKTTGKTLHGNNSLIINTNYESRLENPVIKVSLYRRDYTTEYALNYNLVDLKDYITNVLEASENQLEYIAVTDPANSNTIFYNLKTNLMTGTYKIVFKLYDNTTYIGEAYEYIIIK